MIAGKGRRIVFLLAGPPGVGKSRTAESIVENTQVPLYTMSAGDLGLEPSAIEDSLGRILELVANWNTVLFLDEAGIFLERRNTSDLERNKMVSIFLRMLEYYKGILCLTTNRVKEIDDAIHSRIHVTPHYLSLSTSSRHQIWKALSVHLDETELDTLAQVELYGPQIKNVLKTAQLVAKRDNGAGGNLTIGHIRSILVIENGKQLT